MISVGYVRRAAVLVLFGFGCGGGAAKAPASAPAGDSAVAETRKPPAGPPTRLDCGDFTTCAIAEGGEARCWGQDLVTGADVVRDAPVAELGKVTALALASQFGCALGDGGKVSCWGTGAIANDGKKREKAPPTEVVGVSGAVELAASGVVACARTADAVICWGSDIGTPPKGKWVQLAAGITHACALDDKGAIACWGKGDWGGAKGAFAKPPITGAKYVATGDRHACAIGKDKKVWCWGQNDAGQLGGKSDADAHKKPVAVVGVTGATKLAAGEASTCALLESGAVKCWGEDRPGATSLANVSDVCLASEHLCALTRDQRIVCAGANAHGQIGDGTTERRAAPTPVAW